MIRTVVGTDLPSPNATILRMGGLAPLSSCEADILRDLPRQARIHPAQTELCREHQVQPPLVLLSGWACCQRILGDGRRQILRFVLPGDAIGSLAQPVLPASSTTVALTQVVVADARPLLRPSDAAGAPWAGLTKAIAMMSHVDEIILRDQVVRLGRQTAYERLIHLILELHGRLQAIDMIDGNSFSVPLTQDILADALGLSVVHINRTLQQVRRDRLLDMRGGRITIHQMDAMRRVADWVGSIAA